MPSTRSTHCSNGRENGTGADGARRGNGQRRSQVRVLNFKNLPLAVLLVPGDALVYGHVLEEVGLLPEGLGAVLALERLLPGVGAQMDLYV